MQHTQSFKTPLFPKSARRWPSLFCALFAALLTVGRAAGQVVSFPVNEGFESGSLKAGWTATPSPQGIAAVVAEQPHTGSYAFKMGKSTESGGFQTQRVEFRANLLNHPQVELTFWIYDANDESHDEDGIFFSRDGVQFVKVLQFQPSEWCNGDYGQYPPLDVDTLARNIWGDNWASTNFTIRFQQHDEGDFSNSGLNSDGFFIDDVRLYDAPKPHFRVTPATPFSDNFDTGNGNLSEYWAWRFADKTTTAAIAPIPTRPSNLVRLQTSQPYSTPYCLEMAKRCEDGVAVNAVDLHLDVAGQPQLALTFWIRDNNDETNPDDGIYFSRDGGLTFKKALDFRPALWCNGTWGQHPPIDVDEIARGLFGPDWATSKFIVRFQQQGEGDVSNGGNLNSDGLYIDDVLVSAPVTEYKWVPCKEDFETGGLDDYWLWRNANKTVAPADTPNITRPTNLLEVIPNCPGGNGSFCLQTGKRCEDGFTVNVADWHLNLGGASGVRLSFDLLDAGDETHDYDGIYLSDDGGRTFTPQPVFKFDLGNVPNNDWQKNWPPGGLDLDALAAAAGLSFTKEFVVRFQQYDDGDFSNGGLNSDGIYIDNINVAAAGPTTSARQPAAIPISIFPNPATARANITWPTGQPDGDVAWQLFDAQGRTLRSGMAMATSGNGFSIDLAGLAPGLLTLQITSGAKVWQGRFVKAQ